MHWITLRRTIMGFARLPFLLVFVTFAGTSQAPAQVAVSITVAPPELPVYDQPPIPGPGYIWTPGYWAWSDDGDYYWVPGTWVEPPEVGLLWTPGYWACNDAGIYVWNAGYWGPHIGFYGGVNYGFGYIGVGYAGGFWRGRVFQYNRTVNNFGNVHITNVYNKTVVVNNVNNHVSYNGGTGGLTAKANQQERMAATEHHVQPTGLQIQHQQQASTNREFRHSVNGGHPTIAATSHAGRFEGQGVTAAHHDGGSNNGQHGGNGIVSHGTNLSHGTNHGMNGPPGGLSHGTNKPATALTNSHVNMNSNSHVNMNNGGQNGGIHHSPPNVGHAQPGGFKPPGGNFRPAGGGFRPPGGGFRPPPRPAVAAKPAPNQHH
jgi:hypothetical protein